MKQVHQSELQNIIKRIMEEAETQAKYNNTEYVGLTAVDICDKIRERIGDDWEVIKDGE